MGGICNVHVGPYAEPGCQECLIEVCDFCRSVPTWDYPAHDFTAQVLAVSSRQDVTDITELEPQGSRGGWAACDTCHDLIEAGDWDQLAERSVDANWDGEGGYRNTPVPRAVWIDAIKQYQRLFQENRTGPAIPWEPAPGRIARD